MAPFGSVSFIMFNERSSASQILIKVPHFFHILLRILEFDLRITSHLCGRYSMVLISASSKLPWEHEEYEEVKRLCGSIPVTEIIIKGNRIKFEIISKLFYNVLEMNFDYTVIDMKVIIFKWGLKYTMQYTVAICHIYIIY